MGEQMLRHGGGSEESTSTPLEGSMDAIERRGSEEINLLPTVSTTALEHVFLYEVSSEEEVNALAR